MKNITVFFVPRKITLMFTLYPLIHSRWKNSIHFTSDLDWLLKKDKNKILMIVGFQTEWAKLYKSSNIPVRLRNKYDKLVFFEDNDSSESEILDSLQLFDVLLKKQVYLDKTNYQKNFFANRIYSNHLKEYFGIEEVKGTKIYPRVNNLKDTEKIYVAWNLAFGIYPVSKPRAFLIKKLYDFFGQRTLGLMPKTIFSAIDMPNPSELKCQARFDYKLYNEFVGYQRKRFLEILKGHDLFLSGKIPLKDYQKELNSVKAILSPFGWGEICFRDFEAIFSGAVLIKPNVDHIETYPNIFHANKTYLSVEWGGSDIIEKVEQLLKDQEQMDYLRSNAWNELVLAYESMDKRVDEIMEVVLK